MLCAANDLLDLSHGGQTCSPLPDRRSPGELLTKVALDYLSSPWLLWPYDVAYPTHNAMELLTTLVQWSRRQERRPVMPNFQRVFAMSRRSRQLKAIVGFVLPLALIAMALQVALPHSTARVVAALAKPMYGCT